MHAGWVLKYTVHILILLITFAWLFLGRVGCKLSHRVVLMSLLVAMSGPFAFMCMFDWRYMLPDASDEHVWKALSVPHLRFIFEDQCLELTRPWFSPYSLQQARYFCCSSCIITDSTYQRYVSEIDIGLSYWYYGYNEPLALSPINESDAGSPFFFHLEWPACFRWSRFHVRQWCTKGKYNTAI